MWLVNSSVSNVYVCPAVSCTMRPSRRINIRLSLSAFMLSATRYPLSRYRLFTYDSKGIQLKNRGGQNERDPRRGPPSKWGIIVFAFASSLLERDLGRTGCTFKRTRKALISFYLAFIYLFFSFHNYLL